MLQIHNKRIYFDLKELKVPILYIRMKISYEAPY